MAVPEVSNGLICESLKKLQEQIAGDDFADVHEEAPPCSAMIAAIAWQDGSLGPNCAASLLIRQGEQ